MKYIIACLLFLLTTPLANAGNIYVSINGSDDNPGTKEKPLTTVAMALRKAREWRRLNDPSIKNGIHIIVGGGVYQLYEPIFIRSEDAGTKENPTYIEAAPNEQPILSGGIQLKAWQHLRKYKWF